MGKLNIFEITLSNFNGVYFAGQNLEGHVTVELNDGMKMRGIRLQFQGAASVYWTETESTGTGENSETRSVSYSASETYFNFEICLLRQGIRLQFHGRAYVHWTEQRSSGSGKHRHTRTVHYSAEETYFNFELLLFGPGVRLKFNGRAYVHWTEQHSTGSGKNRRTETRHYSATETYFNFELLLFGPGTGSTVLPAGRHTFPFVYQLPPNLPSSYESHIGNVRYQLKGTIDKPWKFDHTTKKLFTIVSMLDLNTQPTAPCPLQGNNSKFLCCLCCKTGPISATFRIDRTGYVPGDTVSLNAEIQNNSNRKMDASRVRLIMTTAYHATTKTRTETHEVARVQHGSIEPYGSDVWSGDQLHIPPIPPSYLVGCNIIDIRYILMLEVDPSGPAFDLEVPLEIIIGTIPLRTFVPTYAQQPYPPHSNFPSAGAPPPGGAEGRTVSPSAPDLPPPSYAECVFGKVAVADEGDTEYTKGDKDFAPIYTYYDWSKK